MRQEERALGLVSCQLPEEVNEDPVEDCTLWSCRELSVSVQLLVIERLRLWLDHCQGEADKVHASIAGGD